jgi:Holliday junction resolvasome RuvABC endonuclease subunit
MRTLGLRAASRQIWWALVEGTADTALVVDRGVILAPKSYSDHGWLLHLRERVIALVLAHKPDRAAIKGVEGTAKGGTTLFPRLRAEGVIAEACESQSTSAEVLVWKTIASRTGSNNAPMAGCSTCVSSRPRTDSYDWMAAHTFDLRSGWQSVVPAQARERQR